MKAPTLRRIRVRTVAEETWIDAPDSFTLEEILRVKRMPPSLFQGYVVAEDETARPVPMHTHIESIPKKHEIILRCIRNTDLRDVLPQKSLSDSIEEPVTSVEEFSLGGVTCTGVVHDVNPVTAKAVAREAIIDFMKHHNHSESVVVGVSGGGDSNTLIEGLTSISSERFRFYTIVFQPLWPSSAAERASELCSAHGAQHEILGTEELEELLGMKGSLEECYREYSENYGEGSNHFFGTYLISLVARKLCAKHKAEEYVLGFNREDLLAEALYSVMNGEKPLAFPVREFGKIRLLMPLWQIPKTVLDACYPKYSLSNYQERERDKSTFQRNIIYFLSHSIDSAYPNLGLSLMEGFQKLFRGEWPVLRGDEGIDMYPSPYANADQVEGARRLLGKYF